MAAGSGPMEPAEAGEPAEAVERVISPAERRFQTADSQTVMKHVLGLKDDEKLKEELSFWDALRTADNPLLEEFKSLPNDRAIIELLLEKIGEMLAKYQLDPSIEAVLKQQVTESVLVFIKNVTGTPPAALLQEEGGVTTTDANGAEGLLDNEDVRIFEVMRAMIANRNWPSEVSGKSLLDCVEYARETSDRDLAHYRLLMREAGELGVITAGALERERENDEIKP